MAQDEGGYYVKALYLDNCINDNIIQASEFDTISSDSYKEYFQEALDNIVVGFHNPVHDLKYLENEKYIQRHYDEYIDGGYGRFHGIYTYPAMLALFGRIFGIGNIGYLQIVSYYIYVLLCYYILKQIRVSSLLKYTLTFSCAIIPPIIWCGKSYLTEIYLAVLTMEILMHFLEERKEMKTFALCPVIAFCFYHVSAFVFIPLYYLLYFFFFFREKRTVFLIDNIVMIVGYFCGFLIDIKMNLQYIVSNYSSHLSFMNLYSAKTLIFVVSLVSVAAVAAQIVMIRGKKIREKFLKIWDRHIYSFLPGITKTGMAVIGTISVCMMLRSEYMERYSLTAYICFSGIFIFLSGIIAFFIQKADNINRWFVVSLFFIYCIFLLSIFYKKLLPYYYGSRYLAPYMALIFIFGGMQFCKKTGYFLCEIICLCSIKYMCVYDKVLAKYQDDTRVQTDVLLNMIDLFQDGDYIFIEDGNYFCELYVPLKLSAENVYYIKGDLYSTMQCIDTSDCRRMIVISKDAVAEEGFEEYRIVENKISMLDDYKAVYSDLLLEAKAEKMYKNETNWFYIYEYIN